MPAVSDVRVEGSVCEVERNDDMTDYVRDLVIIGGFLLLLWGVALVVGRTGLHSGL